MQRIFLFFFSIEIFPPIVLLRKTEIKFTLNVPSLFRCQRNGPVFYFETFPTDDLFNETIKNTIGDCDLILLSSNKRIIFDIKELYLQCKFVWLRMSRNVNEILFFKSNCSSDDYCIALTPSFVTIITDYMTPLDRPMGMDLRLIGIGTENIQIGENDQYPYSFDRYETSGARRYHIVFKMKYDEYLNMMCRYTYINNPTGNEQICKFPKGAFFPTSQKRSGTSTKSGEGWTWLCYYYPKDVEEPMDYKMISKAKEDAEKEKPTRPPELSIDSYSNSIESWNITEFSEDFVLPIDENENNGSSTPIFTILLVLIAAGGIFYIYKNKCQVSIKTIDLKRTTIDSQDSGMSNESVENDDE